MVVCYIISTHYGNFYTGITSNLLRRWKEHNSKKGKFLSKYKPKEVIYVRFFNDRISARKLEIKIKCIGAKKYIDSLNYKSVKYYE